MLPVFYEPLYNALQLYPVIVSSHLYPHYQFLHHFRKAFCRQLTGGHPFHKKRALPTSAQHAPPQSGRRPVWPAAPAENKDPSLRVRKPTAHTHIKTIRAIRLYLFTLTSPLIFASGVRLSSLSLASIYFSNIYSIPLCQKSP